MNRRSLVRIAGLAAVLLAWQASVPLVGMPATFYPSPADVARAFVKITWEGILPSYVLDSVGRYAVGVAVGTMLGVTLGIGIGLSRTLSDLLQPIISFFYAIVEVVWIPLLVIWWGYGLKTIVLAIVYVSIFPVLYNTIAGVRAVPQVLVNAANSLGASRLQLLNDVVLPASLPHIITGFRVGASFGFRGLIFAEMIAARSGLGYLIADSATNQQPARTVVGMVCMGLLWLFIDAVYLKPFERATIQRWGTVVAAGSRA
jgi:NitT/TauT family transport system permease protein/taurine transport system permease protein